jgi:hypothetical protein
MAGSARLRGSYVFRSAIVISALAVALLAAPMGAAACPSWANVKSFKGTAGASFSQAATKEEYEPGLTWAGGGTWHGSFNQSATGLQLKSLAPLKKSSHSLPKLAKALGTHFIGPTSGGIVSVQDSMVDYEEGGAAGSETASGLPGMNGHRSGDGMLQFAGRFGNIKTGEPLDCRYVLTITYNVFPTVLIKTVEGNQEKWEKSPPMVVAAQTPAMPIKAGLHLSGVAVIPDGVDIGNNSKPGGYEYLSPAFDDELGELTDGNLDNAVMNWNLKPVFAKKHK